MIDFVFHEKYFIFYKINGLPPPQLMLSYFAKQNYHHISNFNLSKVALPQAGYSEGQL